ncbi:hypothetical protein GS429_04220 [Natronorubrum sp. JWXQ-INN-674]|uniref:DUF8164 domain-containing protein n=1 Tax=Natronorubrum halalkaliphilum TaxID=2691917 RepID=A0A6B0VHG9_9EURY|nr:hypothetical protein [Natronorubrum halalkaliphilum]MXV61281.1 hypothetical protein [Natronorubrum halalkaliphilum]
MGEQLHAEFERSSGYSITPFLQGSEIDADGRVEISIFVSGDGSIGETDLDAFLKQDRIDPGERIELGVFVSGIDRIEKNELNVFHEADEVIDVENPGTVRRNLEPQSAGDEDGSDSSRDRDGSPNGSDHVHPVVFRDEPAAESSDYALEGKSLEGNTDENPAYIFEINTRKRAPAGEYSVPIVFTYHSDDGVKQVKHVPSVRITNRRERWLPRLARGTAIIALLVALWALVQFGFAPPFV